MNIFVRETIRKGQRSEALIRIRLKVSRLIRHALLTRVISSRLIESILVTARSRRFFNTVTFRCVRVRSSTNFFSRALLIPLHSFAYLSIVRANKILLSSLALAAVARDAPRHSRKRGARVRLIALIFLLEHFLGIPECHFNCAIGPRRAPRREPDIISALSPDALIADPSLMSAPR